MSTRQIAYRLKSEGKAELIRDQREVAVGFQQTYAAAEKGADQASAAAERQERRFRAMAQAAQDSAQASRSQASYNAVLGVDRGTGSSARDSAAVFVAQAEAMEDGERRARALRSILDPLGAAQDRLNDELREYDALAKSGAISSIELARAQGLARQKFDEASTAIERQSRGLSRLQVSSRLNLARQGADVAVTAAMGMNPAMIAIQQGPQILDAWATSGLKMRGAMVAAAAGIGALVTATGVLIAAWHEGESSALSNQKAVDGLGRTAGLTADELEKLAETGARQADISRSSAREQAQAYVQTGRIGGEVIGDLIAIGKDYASVMGVDAEDATKSLAKAMLEPDKAGRDLTRSMGLLDQKTLDTIDSLTEQGDLMAAQKVLIEGLKSAIQGHAQDVGLIESAWDGAARAAANAWDWIGRALYRSESERLQDVIDRRSDIERARDRNGRPLDARAQGVYDNLGREGQEILDRRREREERAEAATANQRAQIQADLEEDRKKRNRGGRTNRSAEREAERAAREAQQRSRREEDREQSILTEEARGRGDLDAVRRLEDEAALLTRIRQLVDDGTGAEAARTKALAEQGRLLEAREQTMQFELETHARALEIEDLRERGDFGSLQAAEDKARVEESILNYQRIGLGLTQSRLLAEIESWTYADRRADLIDREVQQAERLRAIDLARRSGDTTRGDLLEREDRIQARAREIEAREKLDRGEGETRARREIAEEVDADAEGVRRQWVKSFVADIRRGGIRDALADQFEKATDRLLDKLVDGLFEIDWAGLINGDGSGGKGKAGAASGWALKALDWLIGRNAEGTDNWRGGLTWVGERGPELMNVPRGAQIFDHGRSMKAAAAGVSAPVTNNYFNGNLLTPEFWAQIQRGDQMAARKGATQGAQTAVGFIHGTAGEVQRGERMLKN